MTTCGLVRWNPHLPASATSRPCVRDSEHSSDCRDGYGGMFAGVTPRPKPCADNPIDNTDDTATTSAHAPEEPPMNAETSHRSEHATRLADRLTALLAVRGNAAKMRHALHEADQVFDALHEHLRSGGTPPRGWLPGEGTDGQRYTTAWFDALSETLRDPNARPTLRATANAAEVAWNALDTALREDAPMPEPWDGRRRR